MVSDQEIAKSVELVLRQSDPNAVTSLNSVVQQLEAKLGLSLAHKAEFIRDQITFLLRSHPVPKDQLPPQPLPPPQYLIPQPFHQPHFALQHQTNPSYQSPPTPQVQHPQPPRVKEENAASETPKGRPPAGTKRRGGPGGLNKLCGVSPRLQAIVGQPALPRTEIVRQLWAYIRKHNLQDPENKRKIICNDALRLVFETDCTDMFKMNKLLAKHILPLDPTKESVQAKKSKIEDDSTKQSSDPSLLPVIISDALAKFFGTGEKEMLQSEALGRIWEYVKANQLEDPLSSMVIHCDAKLQELLGCESISALGIQEMLLRHHLLKQS
ncbi:SWIB complex BAF60b domain-containing protein [Perilla frutescens var. hirtella]|uniref:SWIB complex BAF60b domain-containing protein n=1 Tax=Perilla frutescens var. hirtella TaxID=608512 RepID=A0AAD4J4A4_PERFH|nr:SWIB complex BAF60b domain-containing protein [Perilla frutescens var. hirtella]